MVRAYGGNFLADGSVPMTGNLNMGGNDVTGLGLVDGVDVAADVVVRDGSIPFTGDVDFGASAVTNVSLVDGVDIADDVIVRDGSIPFTGNCDLGTNDLVAVGLVDGVDIAVDAVVRDGSIPFTGKLGVLGAQPGLWAFDVVSGLRTMLIGASGGIDGTRTHETEKRATFATAHYDNTEEGVGVFFAINQSGANNIAWGGGSSLLNAISLHQWYVASGATTQTGTENMRLTAVGLRVENAVAGNAADSFHVATSGSANAFRVDDGSGTSAFNGAPLGNGSYLFVQGAGSSLPTLLANTYPLVVGGATSSSDDAVIAVMSGSTGVAGISFGDELAVRGDLLYDNNLDRMTLSTSATVAITIDSTQQVGIGAVPSDLFHVSATGDGNALRIDNTTGHSAFGGIPQSAQLTVSQSASTGAIPVIQLDQQDLSEEMMELLCTIGTGNAVEAVAAKTLTTTHFIKVTLTGGLTRYFPVGTIA